MHKNNDKKPYFMQLRCRSTVNYCHWLNTDLISTLASLHQSYFFLNCTLSLRFSLKFGVLIFFFICRFVRSHHALLNVLSTCKLYSKKFEIGVIKRTLTFGNFNKKLLTLTYGSHMFSGGIEM